MISALSSNSSRPCRFRTFVDQYQGSAYVHFSRRTPDVVAWCARRPQRVLLGALSVSLAGAPAAATKVKPDKTSGRPSWTADQRSDRRLKDLERGPRPLHLLQAERCSLNLCN